MPTTLTEKASRKSTYVINLAPTDEDDTAITPDSVTYTLTDEEGTIINSLEDVAVTPDTSMDVVLSGDDLDFLAGEEGAYEVTRYFVVTAQYDSDLENDLPLIASAIFFIQDQEAI